LLLDKDKIKDALGLEDIKKVLSDLGGGEPIYDREGNMVFKTCCHGGNKHKLYYYEESKQFHCYTDCGSNIDIYQLVVSAKKERGQNYSFPDAVKEVSNITGIVYTKVGSRFGRNEEAEKSHRVDDWNFIDKFKRKEKIKVDMPVYNEKVLEVFLPIGYEPWENEGISLETQREFGVGFYLRNDSIIIPHYDTNNNLIGIRQRNTRQEDVEAGRKYTPVIVENKLYNHPLGVSLYGLHKTKNAVLQTKKLLFFEGEKSVHKAQDFYGKLNFTTAVCASNITNFQRDIALSMGVEEVFISFDKYGEGSTETMIQRYKDKLLSFASKFTPYVRTYILWDDEGLLGYKESPVDRGKEVFEKLMSQKYEIETTEV
jgi:hypothetical protein